MKRSTKIAITVIGGTLLIGGAAMAGKADCFGPGGGRPAWFDKGNPQARADWVAERISARLELDAAQRTKLDDLKNTLLSIRSGVGEERQKAGESIRALLDTQTLDQQRVLEVVNARAQQVEEKAPEIVGAIAGFTDTLNPEQKQLLKQHLEKRAGYWKGGAPSWKGIY